jgi:DNA-binding GntR family transcriptional regulator
MSKNNLDHFLNIRAMAHKHLIKTESSISLLIVLYTLKNFCEGHTLTIKTLNKTLPYSEISIRNHLTQLCAFKLVEKVRSRVDYRVYCVTPTQKLIKSFYKFNSAVNRLN